MMPLVEWNLSTQVSNFDGGERTTGTINPGVIYVADNYQVGVDSYQCRHDSFFHG
jgi:hypothetical protein